MYRGQRLKLSRRVMPPIAVLVVKRSYDAKNFCINPINITDNSAALRFIPKEDLEKEGYGAYKGIFEK